MAGSASTRTTVATAAAGRSLTRSREATKGVRIQDGLPGLPRHLRLCEMRLYPRSLDRDGGRRGARRRRQFVARACAGILAPRATLAVLYAHAATLRAVVFTPRALVAAHRALVLAHRALVAGLRALVLAHRAVVATRRADVLAHRAVILTPRAVVAGLRVGVARPRAVVGWHPRRAPARRSRPQSIPNARARARVLAVPFRAMR